MTLTMLLKCKNGYLFAADSQKNSPNNSQINNLDKIKTISNNKNEIVYTISGEERFYSKVENHLQQKELKGSSEKITNVFDQTIEDVASDLKTKEERVGNAFFGGDCFIMAAIYDGEKTITRTFSYDGSPIKMWGDYWDVRGSRNSMMYARTLLENRHPKKPLEEMDAIDLAYYVLRSSETARGDVGLPIKMVKINESGEKREIDQGIKEHFKMAYKNRRGNLKTLQSMNHTQASELMSKIDKHGQDEIINKLRELEEDNPEE